MRISENRRNNDNAKAYLAAYIIVGFVAAGRRNAQGYCFSQAGSPVEAGYEGYLAVMKTLLDL